MINWLVQDWFSIKWFLPETLRAFQWEKPYFLYVILFLPLLYIFRWLLHFNFRQKLEIALTENDAVSDPIALLRHLLSIFVLLFLSLLLVALARPQSTDEKVEQWTEGIDIMLVLDISESMQIQDFKPNRLEAAKEVATNFINGRFQDRMGLVVFSGDAFSLSPLTTDYNLLKASIKTIDFDLIEARGTAIGSALAVATNRMRESETKSKVVVLLSDGENTAGSIDPKTAADLAYAYGIKIYTIGIGKEGKVPFGTDLYGNTRYVENSMDETSLRQIADIGKGKYFRATNNQALEDIFKSIDQYEKAEIKENRFKDTKDFYQVYLMWSLIFFLIWLALKNTFIGNLMED
ncbi:MAG: VWA domain-containing protein [Bacteroidetes bacterium]|nr:MAG: VWA domain-containing protein [Bacteroidota bacterium]